MTPEKLTISNQTTIKNNQEVSSNPPTAGEMRYVFAEAARGTFFRRGDAFEGMLSFAGNSKQPIHRWFYYKEGYSHELVSKRIVFLQAYRI
jgi:hypothetical protein